MPNFMPWPGISLLEAATLVAPCRLEHKRARTRGSTSFYDTIDFLLLSVFACEIPKGVSNTRITVLLFVASTMSIRSTNYMAIVLIRY